MRPKKPRHFNGIELADNVYPDNKKRPGYWRYKRPDGTFKTFKAETPEQANSIGEDANARRDQYTGEKPKRIPKREQLEYYIPEYIRYQERLNPGLKKKRSWQNRCYAFHQLSERFPKLRDLTHENIKQYWDELTYNQQKLRHSACRALFNWLMSQGLAARLEYNPFTTADDLPRLLLKEKPKTKRPKLTHDQYRKIYNKAPDLGYTALQIAMEISRYTTLREADVCALRWTDIRDGALRVTVSKSEAQKGTARAARHQWTLNNHPALKKIIDQARELSLQHHRCPFILSHKPRRRVWNEEKEHLFQLTADRLSRMFAETRDACGIKGVVFHGVRGLSSTLYKKAGYTNEEIQSLMAHESVNTTMGYQDPAELPFVEVGLRLEK